MRNIHIILAFIVPLLLVCGCSDDNYKEPVPEISVVKSEVWFDCNTNSGTIEFVSDQAVTASCDADWCSVSIDKNLIKVEVKSNDDLEGRTTYVSLKTPSGFETFVAVKQDGVILGSDDQVLYLSLNQDDIVSTAIKFTTTVNIEKVGDWFDYTFEDGTLTIAAKASEVARLGHLTLSSGTKELKVFISQSRLNYEEFLGTWTMKYVSKAGNIQKNVTLVTREKGSILEIQNISNKVECIIPIRYDEKTGAPYFLGTDPVKNKENFEYFIFGWNGGTGLTTSATLLYTGKLNFENPNIEYVFSSNNASYPGIGIYEVYDEKYYNVDNELFFGNLIMTKQE